MTQLSLFTRRKAARPPPAREIALHCMVADTLRLSQAPGWYWMHYPAGELRAKATAGKLKRMGTKAGVADFLLFSPPQAMLHALELKRRGERPSDEQDAFLRLVRAIGGKSDWADSYDEAIGILHRWGAVRVRI